MINVNKNTNKSFILDIIYNNKDYLNKIIANLNNDKNTKLTIEDNFKMVFETTDLDTEENLTCDNNILILPKLNEYFTIHELRWFLLQF